MNNTWKLEALSAVRTFAKRHEEEKHVTETIRAYAVRECGIEAPPNAKVWGPVMIRAMKLGVISKSGYAPTVSSNGGRKVLWHMNSEPVATVIVEPVTTALPLVSEIDEDEGWKLLTMPRRSDRSARRAILKEIRRQQERDPYP